MSEYCGIRSEHVNFPAEVSENELIATLKRLGGDPLSIGLIMGATPAAAVLTGIPVLLFSASQADGALLELDYLTKPIRVESLCEILQKVADYYRLAHIAPPFVPGETFVNYGGPAGESSVTSAEKSQDH